MGCCALDTLVVQQGKSFRHGWVVKDQSFDPTGWSVRAQIRRNSLSEAVLQAWPAPGATAGFEEVPVDQFTAAKLAQLEADGVIAPGATEILCVVLEMTPAVSTAWTDLWSSGVLGVEAYTASDAQVLQVENNRPVQVERDGVR